jgi:predicted phage terminase large subunit-like protein
VHAGLYKPSRHNQLICDALQKVESGDIKQLMIFMPPRHGKSMTASETFPSYFIGKNPNRRVILASYGDSLARKFGRANKRKLEAYGEEVFDINLAKDNSSVTNWDVRNFRGGMVSTGIGGAITGEGADLLLIDDPIKNREEADSETYRNKVWHEWQNTLRTRLHAGGRVVIILTRWHEDDLAGRLLNPEYGGKPDDWHILSLPAICEAEGDVLGRKIGEPLWPEHGYDVEWAEEIKDAVGDRTWSALYQQRPAPSEGSIIRRDWFNYYYDLASLPKFDTIIQSWDCAFKDKKDSDFVVGQVWGRVGPDKYLLAQTRARLDLPKTVQAIERMSYKYPKARLKLVEDKANGPAVVQTMRRQLSGLVLVNPEGGKVARANAIAPEIESGNVFLPSPKIAPWINAFIDECTVFPNGANDDQVDCMTQALLRLAKKKHTGTLPKPRGW